MADWEREFPTEEELWDREFPQARGTSTQGPGFDPDAYLRSRSDDELRQRFDPDAYLKSRAQSGPNPYARFVGQDFDQLAKQLGRPHRRRGLEKRSWPSRGRSW